MSNEEILKKAFVKIRNPKALFSGIVMALADYKRLIEKKEYYIIIFDHDFAKAFWGEEPWVFGWKETLNGKDKGWAWFARDDKTVNWNVGASEIKAYLDAWEYHLQQMVLEEEPLKYLEKFL